MGDSTRRFSSRVADYVRYRPSYPREVLGHLREECGLTRDWVVADIGSGPGNLTRLFLDQGNRVVGVEPNREMREAGESLLAGSPGFTSVDGTAEQTGLPGESVDIVVAAQAFHWFDIEGARREFTRVLRGPQWVALVWNERRLDGSPFLVAYERLLRSHGTDYAAVQHRNVDVEALASFFGADDYRTASFPYGQSLGLDALRGRLMSSSYTPLPGQPGHDEMVAALRRLFAETSEAGRVEFAYDTTVVLGRLAALPKP